MAISYPEFGDFCEAAADVLGLTPEDIERFPNLGLASSALAAPQAGFGEDDLYPSLLSKAAILLERLARNHPLPDGNKRTAFVLTADFLEANGWPLLGADPHDVTVVEQIAAGELEHEDILYWLSLRTGEADV